VARDEEKAMALGIHRCGYFIGGESHQNQLVADLTLQILFPDGQDHPSAFFFVCEEVSPVPTVISLGLFYGPSPPGSASLRT
jgi:hypothetical protein